MEDLRYDEITFEKTLQPENSASFITAIVIKTGLARDKDRASFVLAIIAFIFFMLAAMIWYSSNPMSTGTTANQLERQAHSPQRLP